VASWSRRPTNPALPPRSTSLLTSPFRCGCVGAGARIVTRASGGGAPSAATATPPHAQGRRGLRRVRLRTGDRSFCVDMVCLQLEESHILASLADHAEEGGRRRSSLIMEEGFFTHYTGRE